MVKTLWNHNGHTIATYRLPRGCGAKITRRADGAIIKVPGLFPTERAAADAAIALIDAQ